MTRSEELYKEADKLDEQATELRRQAREERQKEQLQRPLLDRLVFAATSRCHCGAGLAYDPAGESGGAVENPNSVFKGPHGGYWDCSAILLGTAIEKGQPGSVRHTDRLPFAFYEVKSENQPSARGATTRPPKAQS